MVADIRSICTKNTCIDSIYAISIWIKCVSIKGTYIGSICAKSTSDKNVEPRVLEGLEVLLTVPRVNDCCHWLYIRLIFALI